MMMPHFTIREHCPIVSRPELDHAERGITIQMVFVVWMKINRRQIENVVKTKQEKGVKTTRK